MLVMGVLIVSFVMLKCSVLFGFMFSVFVRLVLIEICGVVVVLN